MDKEIFKRDLIPLQPVMQRLGERILGDAEDAEDVVQETFLYLWQRRDDLEGVDNLQGYAMRIVRSRCIDLIRRRNRQADHAPTLSIISDEAITIEISEQEEQSQLLHNLLHQLPERQRNIVELRYLQQQDIETIQAATGMSQANIYTTLSRAISTMRDRLKSIRQ